MGSRANSLFLCLALSAAGLALPAMPDRAVGPGAPLLLAAQRAETAASGGGVRFLTSTTGRNAAGASLTLPTPTAGAPGDVWLAGVSIGASATVNTPPGWSLVRLDRAGTTMKQAVFLHQVTGAEPASVAWTFSAPVSAVGGVVAYRGVDTVSPVDAHGGSRKNPSAKKIPAPSVTTSRAGDVVVAMFGAVGNDVVRPPAGTDLRAQASSTPGGRKMSWAGSDFTQLDAGATGRRTARIGRAGRNIGQLVALSPAPTRVPNAASPLAIGLSFGDSLVSLGPAELAHALDDAVTIGVRSIRVDFNWAGIQPTSATAFDWSDIDRMVTAARARDLSVLPILAYTPAWARSAGCRTEKCAPANPSTFAAFASAAAQRFAPLGIHTWEVWNEPNIKGFWQPAPSSSQYATLVKATSASVRGADPAAIIISGGMAPAATAHGDVSPVDFLAGVCQAGGVGAVDAVGFHPYSFPVPPGYQAPWNAWQQMNDTPKSLTGVLRGCGAAQKKIWITEYGAPTNGPGIGATSSDYKLGRSPDHVDEALQATMATESARLARESGYVAALYWYAHKDRGTNPGTIENFFGLRRHDGTPKPAYDAFRQAVAAP
jgi:hypothetical protein